MGILSKLLQKLDGWKPMLPPPKTGSDILAIIVDSNGRNPRVEQARVYYKDSYTYGYLGSKKGQGLYIAIPSIIPMNQVISWQYLPEIPEKFLKLVDKKH